MIIVSDKYAVIRLLDAGRMQWIENHDSHPVIGEYSVHSALRDAAHVVDCDAVDMLNALWMLLDCSTAAMPERFVDAIVTVANLPDVEVVQA